MTQKTIRSSKVSVKTDHQQLKTILDNVAAYVYAADMETYEILFLNEYAKSVWGDITGQKCWQAIQKDQTGPCEFCTNDKLLKKDGAPAGVHVWEFQNSRNNRWYECRDRAILWTDGRMVRLEVATDITNRKLAQEALQKTETFNRSIIQAIPDIVILCSSDGEYLDIITSVDSKLYLPKEELLGKKIAEVLPQGIAALIMQNIKKALSTGKLQVIEYSLQVPAGDLWFECRIAPLGQDQIIANVLDITGRKQAEARLKNSEEKYRSLINQPLDMIFLHDLDGNILEVNSAVITQTGYPNDELIKMSVFDLLSDKYDRDYILRQWREWPAGRPIAIETGHRRKEGTVYPVEVRTGKVIISDKEYILAIVRDITERRVAEEALRESERRLSDIIDFLPDATFVINQEGVVIAWNRAIEKMTGVPEEEMLGRGNHEYAVPFYGERRPILIDLALMSDNELDQLAGKYDYIKRKGDKLVSEFYVPKIYGGQGAYLSATASRLRDASGKAVGAIETIHDISELKQTEAKLRASEEQLLLMTRNIKDVVIEIDTNGRLLYISPSSHHVVGRGEEMLGRSIFEFIHPEDREKIIKIFDNAIEEGADVRTECRYLHPGEGYIWLESVGSTYQNINNKTVVLVTIRDISESKQAEITMRESEERHRVLVEHTHDIIYSLNAEGIFTFVSPAWKKLLGNEAEDIIGQPFQPFVHPEDVPSCEAFLKEIIETGREMSGVEYRVRNTEGIYRWHTSSGTPSFDKNGLFVSMVGVARDITERKETEDRIRYLSFHDDLTGLYNRAFLEAEIKRLDTRRQLPISIIMADLNGLKLVNDTYGHCAGDEMLQFAADILKKSCREEDIVARWGGDEFMLLLPRTPLKHAENICKRINNNCLGANVNEVPLSIALGVATKDNIEINLSETMKAAENNMYKQKLTESRSARSGVLNALLNTLAAKSYETEEHARRMLVVASKIGEKLGLSDYDLNRLSLLVTLHDIGKINISEDILTKEGPLSKEEWDILKKHPGNRIQDCACN